MTPHVQDHDHARLIGRRAVARGAAWSVPVVALAVAAPANAATSVSCAPGTLSWDNYTAGTNQLGKVLVPTGANLTGLTLSVTTTGDTTAANNGEVTSTSTGGKSNVLRFYDVNNKNNTSQLVTITFSKPVQNLSFSLLDVDSQIGSFGSVAYEDLVTVVTAGWSGTKHANIIGDGTPAHPYRAKNNDSPVAGSSADSNVDLTFAGPLTSVSFVYGQDGKVNGNPFIGISDLTFSYCH
jgi:hypothetical protein